MGCFMKLSIDQNFEQIKKNIDHVQQNLLTDDSSEENPKFRDVSAADLNSMAQLMFKSLCMLKAAFKQ